MHVSTLIRFLSLCFSLFSPFFPSWGSLSGVWVFGLIVISLSPCPALPIIFNENGKAGDLPTLGF